MNKRKSCSARGAWVLLALLLALLPWPPAPATAVEQGSYITSPKERYQLFVFGDKMATGLLAGMWRVLKGSERIVARGRFNAGSGLVRVGYYDWQRAIARVLDSREVDIAVVLLGVNDARDMFVAGRRIPFGSEEWKRVYASRVDAIIETFRNAGVALYWVGLPPMRDPALDAAAQTINAIIRARALAHGVRFIDIRPAFAGPDGGFAEAGPDIGGRLTRLRARNGVHFIKAGNTKLAKLVLDVIERDMERAKTALAAPTLSVQEADKPFVGKAGPDGEPVYEPPAALPAANVVYLARASDDVSDDALIRLRRAAAPDSPARMLFEKGLPPAAPAGRIDDFSVPSQAR